jgi:uncharacterized Zn-binding protein involved in type VI secretion
VPQPKQMAKPVARVTDSYTCPLADPKPHVGGTIVEAGQGTVFAQHLLVAVKGADCTCEGPPDKVLTGSSSVYASRRSVARVGDHTEHGGVTLGASSVIVGG